MNGDKKGDLLVGCFSGFLHSVPATADGFAEESWLTDSAGKEIHTGQYWDAQEKHWAKVSLVEGAPDNLLGLYPDLTDWDGDGDLDLLIGTRRGGIALRINEGSPKEPRFSATPRYVEAGGAPLILESHVSTEFIDLDGDGLRDLVCAQHGGAISWYKNSGTKKAPKFTKPSLIKNEDPFGPKSYLCLSAADMNGDEKADLIVGAKAKTDDGYVPGMWVLYQE